MPLYEYKCDTCHGTFEYIDPMGKPRTKCVCGGYLEHLVGVPSTVLKGKGFHKNDYPKRHDVKGRS